jgi:hypothetical protein
MQYTCTDVDMQLFSIITSQDMGDSFYHIFTTNIPILYTLFFGIRGVRIHNVISKNYHVSDITLIERKIHVYDKCQYAR